MKLQNLRAIFVNAKTTISGIVAAIFAVASQLDALPEDRRGTATMIAIIAAGISGLFARDGDKTSEESLNKGK